jgi:SRSO17 transposase
VIGDNQVGLAAPGDHGVEFARRSPAGGRCADEQEYYLANLPADANLRTLAATIKSRRVCGQAHQQLKEELGLDHFEGRSWKGLHRHALMTMIAYAFLQHPCIAAASGGKENLGRPASPDAADHTQGHRHRPGARSADR